MATIKLPITERIFLNSNEDQWQLLSKGLINELSTSALIEVEPGRKIKINIVLQVILSPDQIQSTGEIKFKPGDLGEKINNGIARTRQFLSDMFDKEMWLMLGYIDGQNKVPILITHFPFFGSIYTQKLKSETDKSFAPIAPSLN